MLESSIEDLDALVAELTAVKARLEATDAARPDGVALWEAETTLRHLGDRATRRADVLKATIEVLRAG